MKPNDLIDLLNTTIEKTRKETAKEILQALRERFVASYLLPVGLGSPDKIVKYAKITEDDIEQLAKQFGVEVEDE